MKDSGFKKEIAKCSECTCGGERLIVNRTHFLCEEKNRERLDKNKDPNEKKRKHQLTRLGLKPVSQKNKRVLAEKAKVYAEIDQEGEGLCRGCRSSSSLSHSHLVPVGYNKSLETVKENITEHCVVRNDGSTGCHDIWEKGTLEQLEAMFDFEENMEIVKRLDPKYYKVMMNRLNENG